MAGASHGHFAFAGQMRWRSGADGAAQAASSAPVAPPVRRAFEMIDDQCIGRLVNAAGLN
jgi:hypothetical protein